MRASLGRSSISRTLIAPVTTLPRPVQLQPEAVAAAPERNLRQHGERRMKTVAGGAALAGAAPSR
jgi:hypothetical protein